MRPIGFTRRREEREEIALRNPEELARIVIDSGLKLHRDLGPGTLESVYEALIFAILTEVGLVVDRKKPIAIEYNGIIIADAFRADLIVENSLIVEIKPVEQLAAVHGKQLLT